MKVKCTADENEFRDFNDHFKSERKSIELSF